MLATEPAAARVPGLDAQRSDHGMTRLGLAWLVVLALTIPLSGCGTSSSGSSVATGELPVDDDFSGDCHWAQDASGGAEVGCVDGVYQITVHDPSVAFHQTVPTRFRPVDHLIIEADVTLTTLPVHGKHDYAYYGVNCTATAAGRPARGYVFIVQPFDGRAGVLRYDETDKSTKGSFYLKNLLAAPPDRDLAGTGRTVHIRAECDSSKGAQTVLTLEVNGTPQTVVIGDDRGFGPFRSAGFDMFTTLAGTTVKYDNVHISSPKS